MEFLGPNVPRGITNEQTVLDAILIYSILMYFVPPKFEEAKRRTKNNEKGVCRT